MLRVNQMLQIQQQDIILIVVKAIVQQAVQTQKTKDKGLHI